MVTMISSSFGLKFVKTGINNEKGFSREETGGGRGKKEGRAELATTKAY